MSESLANPIKVQGLGNEAVGRSLFLPPVLVRELRAALHRRNATKSRFTVARYGVIGVAIFMLFGAAIGMPRWGDTLHFYLFLAGLSLVVGPALQISVGLFAEERRNQTLELLYLTGMGSAELFAGKLLSGALLSSSEFMALGPLLAVPFLSGGVSFDLFLATVCCLPTVFFFVLAVGVLSSALCRQAGAAFMLSVVLLGVFCLALPLPYNLGSLLTGKDPFNQAWLTLSPALGPWLVAKHFGGFKVSDFWVWMAITWSFSGVFLVIAATVLKRNWRRDLQGIAARGWKAKWEALALGGAQWRENLRRRVLDKNAYQWLAQQDRRAVVLAWGFIAAACAFWLLGWCLWPRVWVAPISFYTLAFLLMTGLEVLQSYAAAHRMATDRRDGTLELLLTTALGPADMMAGQKAALDDQFRPVKRGLVLLLLLLVLAGLLSRTFTTWGLVSYLAVWCVFFARCERAGRRLAPMAMWVAANCGRPLYGAFRQGGGWKRTWWIYYLFMMGSVLRSFGRLARNFPTGSTAEGFVVLTVVVWVLIFWFAKRTSSDEIAASFVSHLRSIAQEPLPEINDPRFKEWKDVRTRFPAPSGGRDLFFPREDSSETKPVKAAAAWFWRPVGRICGLAWGKVQRVIIR
jgi:hypothetical protein